MNEHARNRLARLPTLPDEEIDLTEAALWIAAAVDPEVDPEAQLARFDELAAGVEPPAGAGEGQRVARLVSRLYDELGFAGDCDSYYHPDNSLLHRVLDRRRGIPLTLAMVLIEVGRRVGVPLLGVGFPGHFLVRHATQPELVLDPFDGGRPLTRHECVELLARIAGDTVPFRSCLLMPTPKRGILVRLLDNLHGAHLRRDEAPEALAALDLSLLLAPEDGPRIRARGMLRLRLCDFGGAAEDLERYLELVPEAPDAGSVRELVRCARRRRSH